MTANEGLRRYLDAGIVLGQVTRARAEELIRELVDSGDLQRDQAQEWMDDLLERSRQTSDFLVAVVKHEVSTQLSNLGIDSLEDMAERVTSLLAQSAASGRKAAKVASETLADARERGAARATAGRSGSSAPAAAKKAAAKKSGAKKAAGGAAAATKKAPAKKAAAKKAAAKKTAAKKAPAKKAAAKKTAAKKTAGGAAATAKKKAGGAKKTAAKKTAAPAKAVPTRTDGTGIAP